MDKYINERDGQLDFYNMFLPRIDPNLDIENILAVAAGKKQFFPINKV